MLKLFGVDAGPGWFVCAVQRSLQQGPGDFDTALAACE